MFTVLILKIMLIDFVSGKLIGEKGKSISELKNSFRVNILLKGEIRLYPMDCSLFSFPEIPSVNDEKKKKKLKSKKDHRKKQQLEDIEIKLCCIEGTRANIDKCLDKLKEK